MSYKTLLVYLDAAEDSAVRLDAACGLAAHFGAHLSALAMSPQLPAYVASGVGAAAVEINVRQFEESREQAQAIANAASKRLVEKSQLGDTRWVSQELFGLREIAAIHGRQSDLILAGQPTQDQWNHLREVAFEGALYSSGRPVMLLPSNWHGSAVLDNVLVAWDASKEAARALSSAAPILDQAKSVTVAIVDPEPWHQGFGEDPGNEVATVLSRHCKNVELTKIPSSGSSIAQALMAKADDVSANLIVMGGYGHSRFRESLFGGVTREMVERTKLPLFMSH